MAFTFLQSKEQQDSTINNPSMAFTSNVAANSLIIVALRLSDTTTAINSITDTVGTQYTQVSAQIQTTDGHQSFLWQGIKTPSAGANTVQVNLSASPSFTRWAIHEFGADGTQAKDTGETAQQNATSTPSAGGNLTPAGNNELAFGITSGGNAITVNSYGSFSSNTAAVGDLKIVTAYWIQSAATATDLGWTLSATDNCSALLEFYKLSAATGAAISLLQWAHGI